LPVAGRAVEHGAEQSGVDLVQGLRGALLPSLTPPIATKFCAVAEYCFVALRLYPRASSPPMSVQATVNTHRLRTIRH
jgi:hypothetical protein